MTEREKMSLVLDEEESRAQLETTWFREQIERGAVQLDRGQTVAARDVFARLAAKERTRPLADR
ncbi:MAG: hypothetical protein AAGC60_14690 [Acidobacteriota bacterium]